MKHPVKRRLFILVIAFVVISGFAACGGNQEHAANSPTAHPANATETANDTQREEPNLQDAGSADAEKDKRQKDREKLEQDKQKLKEEKAKLEKMKNAWPPGKDTEIRGAYLVFDPPSHVREYPDGKILCTVKKEILIKLHGSTHIFDKNGVWIYTDHCGKMGVIHSTQVNVAG